MRKQLAMVGVVRGFGVPVMLQHLLDSHTVVIVLEVQRPVLSNHLLQLAACRPGECPCTVVQRIANGVVGNGGTVVRGQLVLPIRITIGVRNRLNRSAQRTGSVSILRLAQDVAAAIVAVDPGSVLMRIIYADQLSQCIIGIGRSQITTLFRDDVAAGIVGILERNAILGDPPKGKCSAAELLRSKTN